MTPMVRLATSGLARSPGKTVIRTLVLAAAVSLVGAMLLFVGHSLRTVTASDARHSAKLAAWLGRGKGHAETSW